MAYVAIESQRLSCGSMATYIIGIHVSTPQAEEREARQRCVWFQRCLTNSPEIHADSEETRVWRLVPHPPTGISWSGLLYETALLTSLPQRSGETTAGACGTEGAAATNALLRRTFALVCSATQ